MDKQRYTLLVWDKTGGGFAADVGEVRAVTGKPSFGIGCSYDAFYNEAHAIHGYWSYVLITHEMTNLFTGSLVGGGWPRDWWADDRSPFPYMTAVQIELKLVPEIGIHHLQDSHDPLVTMFMNLKDRYGWEMFRKAFQSAIDDGVNWDRFGGNPSALRTNYVAAYLEIGAGDDLSSYLGGLVPSYDHSVVQRILEARRHLKALPEGSAAYRQAHDRFLAGQYDTIH
jgi:hypothetical protein